jgi:Tol biopolymer transport system component
VKLSTRIASLAAGGALMALLAVNPALCSSPPTPNGGGDPFWSPDGRTIVFSSATPDSPVDQWLVRPEANAPAARQVTREGARVVAWAPDGRSVYCQTFRRGHPSYYALDVASGLERPILTFLGDGDGAVAVSADGRQVAFVRLAADHHNLWVAGFDGSGARQLTTGLAVRSVAWDPSGKRVAFDVGGDFGEALYGLALPDGKPQLLFSELSSYPNWSPDGKCLVVVGMHVLSLVNADGSGSRRLHVSQADRAPLSWSPDGKRLAYVAVYRGALAVATVNTDTDATEYLSPGWAQAATPRWSPDGRSLAFQARKGTEAAGNLYVMAVGTKQVQQLTQSFPSQWAGQRSGDGKQVYFLSNATGGVDLRRQDLSGGAAAPVLAVNPRLTTQFSWPTRSPVGVFVNGNTVWELSPGAAAQQLLKTVYSTSAALSPNGDRLAYVKWNKRSPSVVVRTLAGGAERELLAPPAGDLAYVDLAWSPTGTELALVRGSVLCKVGLNDTSAAVVWQPDAGSEGVLLPPVWSPDGRRLVFGRFLVDNGAQSLEIRVVDADGGHAAVVARGEIVAEHGWFADPLSLPYAWAPDSRRLACCEELEGAPALYTVDLGTPAEQPVLVQRAAAYPEWLPDGQRISYTSLAGNRETLAEVHAPARSGEAGQKP